ncbi:MAG: 5'/3'-nucleotidase SurE [Candidatus Goldbacteria bacterium]|nr:5'/3'-nucleotidase SurE [Candidatus Goldiibacteriota bacterium]
MKIDKIKKYFVLTNDDGINAEGLKILYRAVKDVAEVLVVAPEAERSGVSSALTIWNEIEVKKVKFEDTFAFSVNGTPADCAKIALLKLARKKPDLLLSGTNHGPNICQFILYSGTIGAAAEGARMNVPSISFSIDNFLPEDFSFTEKIIDKIVNMVVKKEIKIKKGTILNVNIPYLKQNSIKGIKVIKTGDIEYKETYKMKREKDVLYFNHIIGKKKKTYKLNNDADALAKGYITMTPLKFDFNDYENILELKKQIVNDNKKYLFKSKNI